MRHSPLQSGRQQAAQQLQAQSCRLLAAESKAARLVCARSSAMRARKARVRRGKVRAIAMDSSARPADLPSTTRRSAPSFECSSCPAADEGEGDGAKSVPPST
eukprot:scaffold287437_cov24-Tisochrysis_lutea.AAC.2